MVQNHSPQITWEQIEKLFAEMETPDECLRMDLDILDDWLETKLGSIGRAFKKAADALACPETIDLENRFHGTAAYAPGNNTIYYAADYIEKQTGPALLDRITLMRSRIHETTHAIQFNSLPSHLLHFGGDQEIVLAPESFARARILLEEEAYKNDQFFTGLAQIFIAAASPPSKDTPNPDNLNFETPWVQNLLQTAHDKAKDFLYRKRNRWNIPGFGRTIANDHYFGLNLSNYAHMAHVRKMRTWGPAIKLIRLSDEDFEHLGNSFGPNCFLGSHGNVRREYKKPLPLNRLHRKWVREINKDLGIKTEKKLPTFSQVMGL